MGPTLVDQVLSIVGALLVLAAFVMNLAHRLDRDGATYAAMNFVGSGLLGYAALQSGALGLIFIEFAWALVSLGALARALLRRPG